jgi:hypothetical protein
MPSLPAAVTYSRNRAKQAGSKTERSNFGLPSFAIPGPVRGHGCGVMQKWKAPPATCDLNCSQRQSRIKLWPRSLRNPR